MTASPNSRASDEGPKVIPILAMYPGMARAARMSTTQRLKHVRANEEDTSVVGSKSDV